MPDVLLLGDPRLRVRSSEVSFPTQSSALSPQSSIGAQSSLLIATLAAFRRDHGFGRAISAPQIGVPLRFIAVNLGQGPFIVANPVVTKRSAETFTMWDDCMSFPDLLVRVRRHLSISLDYVDGQGRPHSWNDLDQAAAELLQHEIDHLDGILAIDRAIDRESLVVRAEFERDRARYAALVDYVIQGQKDEG